MQTITLVLGICIAFTATALAVPSGRLIENGRIQRIPTERFSDEMAVHGNNIKSVIQLHHLSTLQPRDYFSDLISATLGMTVKELLSEIEGTFKSLNNVTRTGVARLDQVVASASPQIQEEIRAIINNAIVPGVNITLQFLEDLGLVIPAISSRITTHDSAADIIWAILGTSLEDLVTAIAITMENQFNLLDVTINDLKDLASQAKPEVANALIEISDSYLTQGRILIIPVLDQLRQLVSSARTHNNMSSEILNCTDSHSRDLLDATISSMLGFNVNTAALQAKIILPQLINILESTRDELGEALALSDDAQVQAKVMDLYVTSMDDVIRFVKPTFEILLQFQEEARHDKQFIYKLMGNLLGIGLEDFKNFLNISTARIESTLTVLPSKLFTSTLPGGLKPAVKVWTIVQKKLKTIKSLCQPLWETLRPILEPKPTADNGVQFVGSQENDLWSNLDGTWYNRDALIDSVSSLLGFKVSNATKTLKTALETLDALMDSSLIHLDMILAESQIDIRSEILGIMNETLTDIHITLQPMLDVLLPFLPDQIRSNKDVALDIYTAINGVKVSKFIDYTHAAAKRVPDLTEVAMSRIKIAATRAGPKVHGQIVHLLNASDSQAKSIIQPFVEIVKPIMTPF